MVEFLVKKIVLAFIAGKQSKYRCFKNIFAPNSPPHSDPFWFFPALCACVSVAALLPLPFPIFCCCGLSFLFFCVPNRFILYRFGNVFQLNES